MDLKFYMSWKKDKMQLTDNNRGRHGLQYRERPRYESRTGPRHESRTGPRHESFLWKVIGLSTLWGVFVVLPLTLIQSETSVAGVVDRPVEGVYADAAILQASSGSAEQDAAGSVGQDVGEAASERLMPSDLINRERLRTEPGSQLEPGSMTYMQVINLEQQISETVSRALNQHIEPEHYLLHVSVEVSTRYYQQEMTVPAVQEEPMDVDERFPGLPFVPPELRRELELVRQQGDGTVETREVHVPEIDRFHIILWADTNLTETEMDLMRQVVGAKVALDPDRGDTFELIRQPFPDRAGPEAAAESDPYFYLLLTALILFALLIGLLSWYFRFFIKRQKPGQAGETKPMASGDTAAPAFSYIDQGTRQVMLQEGNGPQVDSNMSSKEYVMQVILQYPEEIGRLFTWWHENDKEEGLQRAALILQSIDPKLLGVLRNSMSRVVFQKLEELMQTPLPRSSEKKEELLQQFAEQLRMRRQQSDGKTGFSVLPSFDFVHYTSDEKLVEILRSETDRVKALVISHLPDDRKGALLEEFGLEEAARILFCLPQVRNFPFSEYERIASKMFEQTHHLSGSDMSISERDVAQIVEVIESLPVSDQEKYIRQLDHIVSDLADVVRERVITMERISELDDDMIEEAVDSLSREDLAAVLVGTDEAMRTRLLRFRPRREEKLIREEIEEQVFLSREEIDASRARLLDKLREIRDRKRGKAGRMLHAQNIANQTEYTKS